MSYRDKTHKSSPFHTEHVILSDATEVLTSRYDSAEDELLFQNAVVTDATGHSPALHMNSEPLPFVMLNKEVAIFKFLMTQHLYTSFLTRIFPQ